VLVPCANSSPQSEYLNYENTKFSKSRGIGIFGDGAKETGIDASVWRYYLLANRPETGDTQFEWTTFVAANNNELLANLGNFVNRTVKFINAKLDGQVPEFLASYTDDSFDFPGWLAQVNTLLAEYNKEMDSVHLRAGLRKIMEISSQGNALLQYRLDNANLAAHPERTKTVLGFALNLCLLLASTVSPYMPSTAEGIVRQLNTELRSIPDTFDPEILKPGHRLNKAEYLFTRIDDKKVAEWKEMFGGNQESRAAEIEAKRKKQEEKDRKKARKAEKKALEAAQAAAAPAKAEAATTPAAGNTTELPLRGKEKPAEE
jgi:methionyl-tRNA synthetase